MKRKLTSGALVAGLPTQMSLPGTPASVCVMASTRGFLRSAFSTFETGLGAGPPLPMLVFVACKNRSTHCNLGIFDIYTTETPVAELLTEPLVGNATSNVFLGAWALFSWIDFAWKCVRELGRTSSLV